jgi:hypothetical protein
MATWQMRRASQLLKLNPRLGVARGKKPDELAASEEPKALRAERRQGLRSVSRLDRGYLCTAWSS